MTTPSLPEFDIADIVAGACQTSRAHAYELMEHSLLAADRAATAPDGRLTIAAIVMATGAKMLPLMKAVESAGEGSVTASQKLTFDQALQAIASLTAPDRAASPADADGMVTFDGPGAFAVLEEAQREMGRAANSLAAPWWDSAAMFNSHLYPGLEKLVQISQEEIGYLSGASRQRANQALQLLEKEGLLRLDYGGIRVLDLEGLRHFQA